MRQLFVCGALLGGALMASTARDARACGGCFHEPASPPSPTEPSQSGTVVTDHRMIFAVSPKQTTLYDQVEYTGAPSSFAWVLPIHGPVTVALSSDILFAALDAATQTTIVPPVLAPCPAPPFCGCYACVASDFSGSGGGSGTGSSGAGGSGSSSGSGPPPVTVLSQAVVGPYETVQLQSTDPMALETWLAANSFVVPASVLPIIASYVSEGFDFLAMRLAPGQGVQAMRPVSVTYEGAGLSLPLRMVAAGTGATVGITLWVVSTGRYEPQNFQLFSVDPSELTWDWSLGDSDYATVRAGKEAALGNAGWQVESSLDVSPYSIENVVLRGPAVANYLPVPAEGAGDGGVAEGGSGEAGAGQTADQVRTHDLATIFASDSSTGGTTKFRVTRMRADLVQSALANDLVLQASTDQGAQSNVYDVTKSVNAPVCPTYPPCSGSPQPCTPCGNGGYNAGGNAGYGGNAPGAQSPRQVSGCTTSTADLGGSGLQFTLGGLVALSLIRAASKRRRRELDQGGSG